MCKQRVGLVSVTRAVQLGVAFAVVTLAAADARAGSLDMAITTCTAVDKGTDSHGQWADYTGGGDASFHSSTGSETVLVCPFTLPDDTYRITTITIHGDDDQTGSTGDNVFSGALFSRAPTDINDALIGSTWVSVDANYVHTSSSFDHTYVHTDLYYLIVTLPDGALDHSVWAYTVNYSQDP